MAQERPQLKSRQELAIMRESGRIVAETLALVSEHVRPGVTTATLDRIAYEYIRARGAVPSFKGYNGFPATICASVNQEIVHGIPGPRVLTEGDLFSIDCGAFYRGFHTDAAVTVGVGTIPAALQEMIAVGWEALRAGIAQARSGNTVEDIGAAVEQVLVRRAYGVVGDGLAGHGVGRHLHEAPNVPNYGTPGQGMRLVPGLVVAIEPMFTLGAPAWYTLDDLWTVVTADGSLAAHIEHTVAITDRGPEILTQL